MDLPEAIQMDLVDMVLFFSLSMQRDSFMRENTARDI